MSPEEEARNLYYAEVTDEDNTPIEMTVTRIAHETGLPVSKIRKIVFGEDETGTDPSSPYYLKKYHGDVLPVKKYTELKGHLVLQAEAQLYGIMQRMLKKFAESPPDTVSEFKELMGVYTQWDKIGRLEDGKPTEIIKSTNYTPKRIIEIIEADPMYGGKRGRYGKKEGQENEEENYPRRIEGRDGGEGGEDVRRADDGSRGSDSEGS